MLSDCPASAFVGTADLAKSRAFYEQVLGLGIVSANAYAAIAQAGGVRIRITRPETVVVAPYAVLGFCVTDIGAKVKALADRGVIFEHLAFLGEAQDAEGIWTAPVGDKVAWFKDPDGNLLSLGERIR